MNLVQLNLCPSPYVFITVGLLAFGISLVLSKALIKHAWRIRLIDVPNDRSSHKNPIPRAGGIAIFLSILIAQTAFLAYSFIHDCEQSSLAGRLALLLPIQLVGALVFAMGLWDDLLQLSAKRRLVMQALLGAIALIFIYEQPLSPVPFFEQLPTVVLAPLTFLGLLWWLNLYNFMDGIDAIAGAQALFMSASALAALVWSADSSALSNQWLLILGFVTLMSSCAGFLVFNWHPAKIFMGDCGSLLIAFLLFILAIISIQRGLLSYHFWLIIGASFVVDATYTLAMRIRNGESLTTAHRSHLYQLLTDLTNLNHAQVAMLYSTFNLVVLFPLAALVQSKALWADTTVVLSYVLTTMANIQIRKACQKTPGQDQLKTDAADTKKQPQG